MIDESYDEGFDTHIKTGNSRPLKSYQVATNTKNEAASAYTCN